MVFTLLFASMKQLIKDFVFLLSAICLEVLAMVANQVVKADLQLTWQMED
jgi:hypothetical protein